MIYQVKVGLILGYTVFLLHCGQGLVLDSEPILDLVEESTTDSNGFSSSTTGTNSFGATGGSTSGSTRTNSSGATGSPTTGATGSPPGNPFR